MRRRVAGSRLPYGLMLRWVRDRTGRVSRWDFAGNATDGQGSIPSTVYANRGEWLEERASTPGSPGLAIAHDGIFCWAQISTPQRGLMRQPGHAPIST